MVLNAKVASSAMRVLHFLMDRAGGKRAPCNQSMSPERLRLATFVDYVGARIVRFPITFTVVCHENSASGCKRDGGAGASPLSFLRKAARSHPCVALFEQMLSFPGHVNYKFEFEFGELCKALPGFYRALNISDPLAALRAIAPPFELWRLLPLVQHGLAFDPSTMCRREPGAKRPVCDVNRGLIETASLLWEPEGLGMPPWSGMESLQPIRGSKPLGPVLYGDALAPSALIEGDPPAQSGLAHLLDLRLTNETRRTTAILRAARLMPPGPPPSSSTTAPSTLIGNMVGALLRPWHRISTGNHRRARTGSSSTSTHSRSLLASDPVLSAMLGLGDLGDGRCTRWVVTLARGSCDAPLLLQLRRQPTSWCGVIVADAETPDCRNGWNATGSATPLVFLPHFHQQVLPFLSATVTPWTSTARKNLGYLVAIDLGAEQIIDADCRVALRFGLIESHIASYMGVAMQGRTSHIGGAVCEVHHTESTGYANAYSALGVAGVWPRGMPLRALRSRHRQERTSSNECANGDAATRSSASRIAVLDTLATGMDTSPLYRMLPERSTGSFRHPRPTAAADTRQRARVRSSRRS